MYRQRPNYLFYKVDWHSVNDHQYRALADDINEYDSNKLLNTPIDDLAAYFEHKYQISVPILREDEIVADQHESQIDVSQDPLRLITDRSRPVYVPGTEVEIAIPFDGESDLFSVRPSTYTLNPPIAQVDGNSLILRVSGTDLAAESVKAQINRTIGEINSWLQNLRQDAQQLNGGLLASARAAIERR